MKKVFVTFLAVASVIACTKSNVEFEETTEIGLKPVAHNVTKSMMTETPFQTSESFNVWAFYKQVDPGTSIADWQAATNVEQTTYINEKEFIYNDDTTWKGATSYYWPKMGSLLFAGYYPTDIKNQVEYTFNATENKMVISNYVPDRDLPAKGETTTYTEDLMYANMTLTSYSQNPVSLVFKHALSWITVKVKQSEAGPKIIVDNVNFTNVYPQGTATVDNMPVNNVSKGIEWVTAGTAASVPVLKETRTVVVDDSEVKKVGYVLTTQDYTLAYEPLFIPQPMTTMVITYTIESGDGSSFQETKTVDLSGLKTDDTDKWEAGKHYTYTITIGTDEILIAPKVTDWKDVEYDITPGVEAQL